MCKPAYVVNTVFTEELWLNFPLQFGCVVIVWFLLVCLNLLEIILQTIHGHEKITDPSIIKSIGRNKYISWFIAVFGFTLPIALFYYQNFQNQSFCLMNRQEPICQQNWEDLSSDIDCLELATKPNSSVEAIISEFSGMLESG